MSEEVISGLRAYEWALSDAMGDTRIVAVDSRGEAQGLICVFPHDKDWRGSLGNAQYVVELHNKTLPSSPMPKLQNCPCGSQAVWASDPDQEVFRVHCRSKLCFMSTPWNTELREAYRTWNNMVASGGMR